MSDPVDTDALRALANKMYDLTVRSSLRTAANEVDRLRTELAISENRAGGYEEVLAHLRTALENAPHEPPCPARLPATFTQPMPCTCWKADVL